MYSRSDFLFCEGDLTGTLHNILNSLHEVVEKIPTDQFMASSEEQLPEHLVSELKLEPITLYEDRATMDQEETTLDMSDSPRYGPGASRIPGTKATVMIPYTGDSQLWKMRPNSQSSIFPRASYLGPRGQEPGFLIIPISKTHDASPESFKKSKDDQLDMIKANLKRQRLDIENFNNRLPQQLLQAIQSRRERLKKHQGLEAILGIPLRSKPGSPPVEPIKITKKITVPLPPPPQSGFQAEPGIDPNTYDTVLKIIRHGVRSFESTPKTFHIHDEEELRDILLSQLNGIFEGQATGETFRRSGKTDIIIKDGDRTAFVAECKVWHGESKLGEALDQLLSYLTWRDCKAALIIFNKTVAGFSGLQKKVPSALQANPLFLRLSSPQEVSEWRMVFKSKEDEGRWVTVHIFLVNLYVLENG